MATTYTRYTGGSYTTAAIYTVPTGKVAKVIVNQFRIWSGNAIYIGDYRRENNTGQQLYSWYASGTAGTSVPVYDIPGMLTARSSNSSFNTPTMAIKDTHILLAGQTVYFDSGNSQEITFTVIEEDI